MMGPSAAALLQQQKDAHHLDNPLSRFLLTTIASVLDDAGAHEWNLIHVALVSVVVLGCVRWVCAKRRGIDWYALVHAVITGGGAMVCLYLNATVGVMDDDGSDKMLYEPFRSITCQGPLTNLHRIIPAVTMGYAIFDIIDGMTISLDFMLHGLATMLTMAIFCVVVDAPQIVAPMLFMEGSTIFLTVVRADFFSDTVAMANQACFCLSFLVCRIIVVPYYWAELMWTIHENQSNSDFTNCFPGWFAYVCFGLGMFFNVLNSYWMWKIVKKMRRKLLGIEKPKANNDWVDEAERPKKKEK